MQRLRRVFWSLYGRFVWDTQKDQAPQVRRIVETLHARQVAPGERVLDAGCGTGNYALGLAQAGLLVTGIDYAAGMLARAQDKVTRELSGTLSFHQADLNARLGFPDEHFDHAINVSVLQATADPAFTLGELWRVLKPGGALVLLHVARPESHALPLWQAVSRRVRDLGVRTPWKAALVGVKTWAERSGNTRYWTAAELQDMLKASRFDVLCVDLGPPIMVVVEKDLTGLRKPVRSPSFRHSIDKDVENIYNIPRSTLTDLLVGE